MKKTKNCSDKHTDAKQTNNYPESFCFFYIEKAEAEKRMVEIVNYVKVQCSTYTHYNESSESKSLLRAIEGARQMSTNINM